MAIDACDTPQNADMATLQTDHMATLTTTALPRFMPHPRYLDFH